MSRAFFGWIEKIHISTEENMNILTTASKIMRQSHTQELQNAILHTCAHVVQKRYYLKWHGPKNLFFVRIALLQYQKKEIFIPKYGWLFWEWDMGFFGDGLTFFQKS